MATSNDDEFAGTFLVDDDVDAAVGACADVHGPESQHPLTEPAAPPLSSNDRLPAARLLAPELRLCRPGHAPGVRRRHGSASDVTGDAALSESRGARPGCLTSSQWPKIPTRACAVAERSVSCRPTVLSAVCALLLVYTEGEVTS